VIELNRAVAVGMAEGPVEGLAIVDGLANEPALKSYHLLPTVRGDFLERLGRHEEARAAFEAAAKLTANTREREMLRRRAAAVAARSDANPGGGGRIGH
jgi:predicted RNA polymerase sigma factor